MFEQFRNDTHGDDLQVVMPQAAWQADPEREFMQWRALVNLETLVVHRRYEQVRTTMLLRAWTRYVGFLTGMILSLVGAVFVLGKLGSGDGATSTLTTEAGGVKSTVNTPYPGVALSMLGTLLMALSILVPFEFDTRDIPAYLKAAAPAAAAKPPPSDWPEQGPEPAASGAHDSCPYVGP